MRRWEPRTTIEAKEPMARSAERARRKPPRVMRVGKTRRDHESGAWANHLQNKQLRRLNGRPWGTGPAEAHSARTGFPG